MFPFTFQLNAILLHTEPISIIDRNFNWIVMYSVQQQKVSNNETFIIDFEGNTQVPFVRISK